MTQKDETFPEAFRQRNASSPHPRFGMKLQPMIPRRRGTPTRGARNDVHDHRAANPARGSRNLAWLRTSIVGNIHFDRRNAIELLPGRAGVRHLWVTVVHADLLEVLLFLGGLADFFLAIQGREWA